MKRHKAQPGDKVELANKDVGFFDPETEFKIVRSQEKELGETVGHRTNLALNSGALLVVSQGKPEQAEAPKSGDAPPEDLPGRELLESAGLSFEAASALAEEGMLETVDGIGPKTADAIAEYFGD